MTAANHWKVSQIFVAPKNYILEGWTLWSEKTSDAYSFEWGYNCTEMVKDTCYFKLQYIVKPGQPIYILFS